MLDPNIWLSEQREAAPFLNRWQSIIDLMAKIFNAPAAFIVQHTDKGFHVTIASQQKENPYPADITIPLETNIFCKKIVETCSELYVREATKMKEWDTNPEVTNDGFNSYLGFPIMWPNGQPYGTICVMDFEVTDYNDDYISLIGLYRDLVQSDLELLNQFEQLHQLAMRDELTKLLNRRGFLMLAEQRLMLARRHKEPLGIIYIDMKSFKNVNDKLGHDIGDFVLKRTAQIITSSLRSTDIASRYGGDEFILMVNMSAPETFDRKLKEMNQKIQSEILNTKGVYTGINYGIVSIDDNLKPLESWISKADEAMYAHKHSEC